MTLTSAQAPKASLLIREVHVVDPRSKLNGPRDVLIADGEITEIATAGSIKAPKGVEIVEGEGKHLFPAFVDPHVHFRTPGQEHKEDLETGTRSAAAGGYCAVICMPNTDPTIDSVPVLRSLHDAAARDARIPVGFSASITIGLQGEELTEMAALREEGALCFTDDGKPIVAAGTMRKALQYQKMTGAILALHEEDPSLSGGGAMHEGEVSALLGIAGIPSVSESVMVARDCLLAEHENGAVHMQHLSSLQSVQAVAEAKKRGVKVTCEASPHHLLLTHEDVRGLDTRLKMNPPLREEADRQALIEGLKSGVIDCIATDHAPHARDEKEVPFEQAPMGTTGLETAFAAIYTELVEPGILPLELVIEKLTVGGSIFGLHIPQVEQGRQADIVVIDLAEEWTVGEAGYESRSANCCFDGRRFKGRVKMTLAAGSMAFRARSLELVS